MRTSNPALKDKVFERETGRAVTSPGADEVGWAQSQPAPDTLSPWSPTEPPARPVATMRLGGVLSASAVLLVVLAAAGWFGWQAVEVETGRTITGEEVAVRTEIPPWVIGAVLAGLVIAILAIFVPKLARITAPLYAVAEGLLVGAVSHVYELRFDGIVLQAVGLTVGVFLLLLFLYATRIIKVTENLRMGIVAATGAVFLVYLATWLLRIVGTDVGMIHDAGLVGIGFSLVVVTIAALNLVLDFDFVERGIEAGAPRHMEWYAAFGLLVTLVWLYLELLRLLGKLRSS